MRIDPTPFVRWFDAQAAEYGAQAVLSRTGWDYDTGTRKLHRWRNGERADALDLLDACHLAGVSFDALFDEAQYERARRFVHDEGEAPEGREWTARCKLGKPSGVHGRMTEAQVRAAHVLYMREGLSFRALGALLWERFGYASAKACANSLCGGFKLYGLPARERIEATVRASTVHGKASREAKRRYTPEYAAHRRQLRLASGETAGAPQCAGTRLQYPRKGAPCQLRAMIGSRFCRFHEPVLRDDVVEQVTRARAVLELAA